ncbi:MAG TPA: hypothetical protein VG815_02365 [Chloroflexota bacterium]|jgi:hypothetical protein|nr:hypothetical protein [Chloroflexota bacterium]
MKTTLALEGEQAQQETARSGLSRRTFVKATGLVVVGGAALPLDVALAAGRPGATEHAPLNKQAFLALRGERFVVERDCRHAVLELVSVADFDASRTGGRRTECFALRFRQVRGRRLVQATYLFHHHSVRPFELFIVPGGADRKTRSVTAIINRLV